MYFKGKTALVTGASSGIGKDFASLLAAGGCHVIITARREERLEALATSLREAHGVTIRVVAGDLSNVAFRDELFAQTETDASRVDVLINNAGFGTQTEFVKDDAARLDRQLQLNIVGLTDLTHRYAQRMVERGEGWIMNVASIGAYLPVPMYATYAAGKAYVRNFTEALAFELAPRGVTALCLNPGGTRTEFMDVAGQEFAVWQQPMIMSSERCARIGLSALRRGRRNIISGWLNSHASNS